MNLKLLKDWRILMLIVLVIVSIAMIVPSQQKGVLVRSVASDSPFHGKVAPGDIITWANEEAISTPEDLYKFDDFTGVFRYTKNGKLELVNIGKPGLKMIVEEPPTSKLKFGMDLVGGTRVLLAPTENVSADVMSQIVATLETRINIYGLRESKFQPVTDVEGNQYVQIEMAGGSREEIEDLLSKQGVFEGKIARIVEVEDSTGTLWGKEFTLLGNESIEVDGRRMSPNDTIEIGGIEFEFLNATEEDILLLGTVFKGIDIKSVCMQEQAGICTSRLLQQENGWSFMFQVFVTEEGAERFAKVTEDMDVIVDPNSGESYLDGKIFLFLDDNLITSLNIASELAGQAYTEPLITGFRQQKEDALSEKLKLQSILQSGALPVGLEIVRSDQISPSLGQEFMSSAITAGILSILVIGAVVFVRYRRIKIALPVVFTTLSEAIIILGAATLINWTIDLASIAGIIAAVGTGVDAQIMIIDELLLGEKKIYTLKQKVKRAMFIIFSSASTIIAAMMPLMFIGIGVMRGFAITTIIGVLIGVFIARPAFGKIAETVLEKEATSE